MPNPKSPKKKRPLSLYEYFGKKGTAEQRAEWERVLKKATEGMSKRQLVKLRANVRRAFGYRASARQRADVSESLPEDKRSVRPTKYLSALANSPVKVMEAFNALTAYGVDPVRLCNLIKRRKHPPHRPRKSDEHARLAFSVKTYQEEHPGATDKDAILAILNNSETYRGWPEELQIGYQHRMQTALSRYKKRQLQKPH